MVRNILIPILLSAVIFSCSDLGGGSDDVSFDSSGDFFGDGTSTGGSLARFTIIGDYLYIVNDFTLIPIDISNLENPEVNELVELGVGIETIFPFGDVVLIGSQSAMYIVSVSDPTRPRVVSTYEHFTACDPVVARGDYAYVTLREGTGCGNFAVNTLDVVNISSMNNPSLITSISMSNPRGLGIGCNNKLYVCEGPTGFVQFDISDPANPVREIEYSNIPANDVIVNDSLLIVTGSQGIHQYYCDQSDTLKLISILPYAI